MPTRTLVPSGFNLVSGSYLGNGQDSRNIEIGFRPSLIIVKGAGAQFSVFRTTDMPSNECGYVFNAVANLADSIQDFFDKGFIIGTDASVNTAGVIYHWIAVSEGNAHDFAVFTYTGNGAVRDITRLTFQPSAVF